MGAEYTFARVNTNGKADLTYGRFDTWAKLPNTTGIWPAIWMMPILAEYGDWFTSRKINIMEMIERDPIWCMELSTTVTPKTHRSAAVFSHP
jgi:beta-glucanase (GH16 family)